MSITPNSERDPLASVLFISLPPTLKADLGGFVLNPAILLPVEGSSTPEIDPVEGITWEMILSGMLKILAWKPDHPDIQYYRDFITAVRPKLFAELTEAGIIKARNHEFDLAEEILRALIGLEPANCQALVNLAILMEERAKHARDLNRPEIEDAYENQAHTWYRRAQSLDEVVPEAWLYGGYFHLRHHNIQQAKAQLEEYVRVGKDEDRLIKVRSLLKELAKHDAEDQSFKEAFDCIRMGKELEGIERIHAFLREHPKVWNAWFLLGWGLRRLERYAEGLEAFETCIKHGGETTDTLNELAICSMELGNYKRAKQALEKALQMEPENIKILSNLGILSIKQGDNETARDFFRIVLEFEPEDRIARSYLEHLGET